MFISDWPNPGSLCCGTSQVNLLAFLGRVISLRVFLEKSKCLINVQHYPLENENRRSLATTFHLNVVVMAVMCAYSYSTMCSLRGCASWTVNSDCQCLLEAHLRELLWACPMSSITIEGTVVSLNTKDSWWIRPTKGRSCALKGKFSGHPTSDFFRYPD